MNSLKKHNATFVTAFINNANKRKDRDQSWYLERGKVLLNISVPKIVFIEKDLIPLLSHINPDFNLLIPYCLNDMYLYDYINSLSNNVITNNPNKDTIEYFMVQCNKTEWVKKAIEINHFNTEQFIWIDFGIYQFYEDIGSVKKRESFSNDVIQVHSKTYRNIRIPHIWPLEDSFNMNIKRNVLWFFTGSLFGGDYKTLINFAEKMKIKCLEMVEIDNTLVWEVNIWVQIYQENADLFDLYFGEHAPNVLENY